MLHGNFGEDPLKSTPLVGGPAAESLIVVDDQNPIPGPSPGRRQVGEGVLPFPRFAMIEDLLGIGLAHVDDDEAIEVPIQDLERSQDAGQAGRFLGGESDGCGSVGRFGRIKGAHGRPPLRREAWAVAER